MERTVRKKRGRPNRGGGRLNRGRGRGRGRFSKTFEKDDTSDRNVHFAYKDPRQSIDKRKNR